MILTQKTLTKNVIGVVFDGLHLHAARIENGKITESIHAEINNRGSEESILGDIILTIKQVYTESVEGIGVGVPGLVDIRNGIVLNPTILPSWRRVHLKDIIEEHFNTPAHINNNANCFALGEKHFGVAKDFNNIAGISIETGLGVGIIIDGKLYSGRNAGAGEFCSIPYKDHNYEYYCCERYFEEKYGLQHNILLNRAHNKDKIALAIYELFGIDLGNVIKAIMYALDPDAVVIGGTLSEAYEFYEESMLKTVNTFNHKNTLKYIRIMQSTDPNIPVYGAAALCF